MATAKLKSGLEGGQPVSKRFNLATIHGLGILQSGFCANVQIQLKIRNETNP
jgi:hypothetical protein